MPKSVKTHIVCFDDQRGFADEVRKRFTDLLRYQISSFNTREDVIRYFERQKEHHFCKIAIFGIHDNIEHNRSTDQMISDIKKIDPKTGIILIGPPDKMEEIRRVLKFNVEAYIPKNSNMILRIHNAVKKIISEHNIGVIRKRRNLSLYALLTFLLISVIFMLLSYFRFPGYF